MREKRCTTRPARKLEGDWRMERALTSVQFYFSQLESIEVKIARLLPPPLCHLQEKEGGVDERATSRSVGLPSSFSLCPTFSLFLSLQLVESWLNWINVPKRNKKKKKRWSARESVAMASLCTHTHTRAPRARKFSLNHVDKTGHTWKNIHRLAVHSFSYRPMWRKSLDR
jgi:hypothetical protein